MKIPPLLPVLCLIFAWPCFPGQLRAQDLPAQDGTLVDLSGINPESLVKRFASAEKSPEDKTLTLNFENNPRWPSVDFLPASGTWNLSTSKQIEVTLTNEGEQTVKTFVQVANPGHEVAGQKQAIGGKSDIAPGQTKTILVDLSAPSDAGGYHLDPSKVSRIRIFVGKVTSASRLKLLAIKATGEPAKEGKH